MRVSAAAIAAVAMSVTAAQTSTNSRPFMSTMTTSSSSNDPSVTKDSVSCVFRYSMPTATNLPRDVFTPTDPPSPSPDSKDDEYATKEDGSRGDLENAGEYSEYTPTTLDSESDKTETPSDNNTNDNNTDNTKPPSSNTRPPSPNSRPSSSNTRPPSPNTRPPSSNTRPSPSDNSPTSSNNSSPPSDGSSPSSPITSPVSTPLSSEPPVTPISASSVDDSPTTTVPPTTSTGGGSHEGRRLLDQDGDVGSPMTVPAVAPVTMDTSGSTGSAPATTGTVSTVPTSPTSPSSPSSPSSPTSNNPSRTTTTPLAPRPSNTPSSGNQTTNSSKRTPSTATSSSDLSPVTQTQINGSSKTGPDYETTQTSLEAVTIEFSCDMTFYSAWEKMGLTCGGTDLDAEAASASAQCLIYSGTSSGTEISDLATCMSVCRFPACKDDEWDYSSDDGLSSAIYANLDFIMLMKLAGTQAAEAVADAISQPFSNLTFAASTECDYLTDNSFTDCQCASAMTSVVSQDIEGSTHANAKYSVPSDKGLGDMHHWPDGKRKSNVDQVGIASATIGGSAATVSVFAGGVMSVAGSVIGGTSAGVASSVSAAASVGITLAAVDICQFSIMLNQMNVDARPRFMENMGKQMAPAAFTFLPFGHVDSDDSSATSSDSTSVSRRLVTGSSANGDTGSGNSTADVQGMEKYAALVGVKPGMLFYLAVAGIACMVGIVFGLYAIAMGVSYFFVKDFSAYSSTWLDKAIGVLMMILILSEYVVGATAMYQICYCIDNKSMDASFVLSILALLGLAFGTILYGVLVIKNNEDELRDLGTKDHFDKKFHNRYGPLYDEHSFEGRFFFAPKLLLALLCGMTTGMVWIEGLWQIVVLIAFHIVFLLYLEIKQPYPTAFVQKTSSFVIIVKISALFLSFFLLSSATSFTESIPDDLREGVAFAIVGLQVLVLVCLMIRQVYIFYRTWKLKRDGASEDKTVTVQTTNAREGSDAFFALGGEPQYYNNNTCERPANSPAVLGDDSTPSMQDPRQYVQETPPTANYNHGNQLRGLQPQHGMQRTHTVVQHESHRRNHEVDL